MKKEDMLIIDDNGNRVQGIPVDVDASSKELISRLIRKEFDSIDYRKDWLYRKSREIIQAARVYGFLDLAQEMSNDLLNETR